MRFIIGNDVTLTVEHDSKTISWNVAAFNKKDASSEQEEWVYINSYIATLKHEKQTKIFNAMKRVRDEFDTLGKFELNKSD